jgi:salicylate hydroxylase
LPHLDKDQGISSEKQSEIFRTFANLRQPRTAALVKGARAQGESRVIDGGVEACLKWDDRLRQGWEDDKVVEAKYDALFREPY